MPPYRPGYFVMTEEVPYRCRRTIGQDREAIHGSAPQRVNRPPLPTIRLVYAQKDRARYLTIPS